jgi:cobalt-zinc-cadmium efflux system outer membrane protein
MTIRKVHIAVLLVVAVSHAQPTTLQQAEQAALRHNRTLLAQRYELSAADADLVTAHLLQTNPSLTLSGDVFPHPGTIAFDQKNYSASLAFPVTLGGKRSSRVEAAEHAKDVTAQTFEDAVRNLLLNVRTTFYDALNAKYSLELATSTIASLDSVVALNRVRLDAKDISESELMRTEVAALAQHVLLESAQIDFKRAKANLQVAIGSAPITTAFDIEGDLSVLPDSPATSFEKAKQTALERRPDLQALRSQLAFAESNKKLQEALSIIDLSVGGYYSNQQGQSFSGLSLSVPIPIFNRNQGEIEKAGVRVEQAQGEIAALEHQIEADVQTAWDEFTARKSVIDKLQNDIVTRSRSIRQVIEYAYKKGGASVLDFLDAQRTFNDTMKSYYDALTGLHKSAFALQAAMGE